MAWQDGGTTGEVSPAVPRQAAPWVPMEGSPYFSASDREEIEKLGSVEAFVKAQTAMLKARRAARNQTGVAGVSQQSRIPAPKAAPRRIQ